MQSLLESFEKRGSMRGKADKVAHGTDKISKDPCRKRLTINFLLNRHHNKVPLNTDLPFPFPFPSL
jgi:hypothetical protein